MARTLVCGESSTAAFAIYDQLTFSWKTSQRSLWADEDWVEFSESFPARGTMRSGRCYRQSCSVFDSRDGECSSWHISLPTPPELWPTLIAGSEGSHTNGRSCIGGSHRHLLEGRSLSPSECEALTGLPTGWTLGSESVCAPTQ